MISKPQQQEPPHLCAHLGVIFSLTPLYSLWDLRQVTKLLKCHPKPFWVSWLEMNEPFCFGGDSSTQVEMGIEGGWASSQFLRMPGVGGRWLGRIWAWVRVGTGRAHSGCHIIVRKRQCQRPLGRRWQWGPCRLVAAAGGEGGSQDLESRHVLIPIKAAPAQGPGRHLSACPGGAGKLSSG